MKTPFSIFFDGSCIQICNEAVLIEQFNERYKPDTYLDCEAQEEYEMKSSQAMGRFFGAVATAIYDFLTSSGYKFSAKKEAVYYIMENLPSDAGYGLSDRWVNFVYDPNGRVVSRKAMPISDMSKKELHELDNDLSKFLAEMSIEVPPSEEFKKKKQLAS